VIRCRDKQAKEKAKEDQTEDSAGFLAASIVDYKFIH
jgi:hypothetical protein